MTILLLAAASSLGVCISGFVRGGAILFYSSAGLMGISQALLYPTLTTYLSFVLPKTSRNVLLGLFIAMADLGVSLGSAAMGPLADLTSYSVMYLICAILSALVIVCSYDRQGKLSGAAALDN